MRVCRSDKERNAPILLADASHPFPLFSNFVYLLFPYFGHVVPFGHKKVVFC